MGNFTFNGLQASTYGLIVSGINTMNGAERRVTQIQIPGRNGDVVFDDGAWNNVRLSYPCAIKGNYQLSARNVRNWLGGLSGGYYKLTDTYNPGEYRMARFAGAFVAESWAAMRGADVNVEFDCKPQRYLTIGDDDVTLNAGSNYVANSTPNNSLPIFKITATHSGAKVTANGRTMTINTTVPIVIDCENMLVYRQSNGANMSASVSGEFPFFTDGINTVTLSQCSGTVKPRWFNL